MLPDPKKVARLINRTLFQSPEERRQDAELERDVQVRLGKARLRRHIGRQREMEKRLMGLAKRSLFINDPARFRQVGQQLLWTRGDILRWERYLLSLEVLEARRDQVKASVDLIESIKTMSESLAGMAGPQQVADLQRQLEQGLARAASLEERMAVMMEMVDGALSGETSIDEAALEKLESALSEEIAGDEASAFDREIEEGLRKIREELVGQEK